jgi:hypothetical protein
VKWLFNAAGAPLPAEGGVDVCNMRTATAEQVVQMLLGGVPIPKDEPPETGESAQSAVGAPPQATPAPPVDAPAQAGPVPQEVGA